jgi:hypothetical protein
VGHPPSRSAGYHSSRGAGVFVNEAFFSPDGNSLGFFDSSDAGINIPTADLKKVSLRGGPPMTIATVGARFYGADWATHDTIVFAVGVGVFRVPATGGKPELLAAPEMSQGNRLSPGRSSSRDYEGSCSRSCADLVTRPSRRSICKPVSARPCCLGEAAPAT